jgi:hypothetical protein
MTSAISADPPKPPCPSDSTQLTEATPPIVRALTLAAFRLFVNSSMLSLSKLLHAPQLQCHALLGLFFQRMVSGMIHRTVRVFVRRLQQRRRILRSLRSMPSPSCLVLCHLSDL